MNQWEIFTWNAVQREATRSADCSDRRCSAAGGDDRNLTIGHQLHALEQVTCADCDSSTGLDLRRNLAADGEIQIGRGQAQLIGARDFEQDIPEYRHSALFVRYALAARENSEQVFLGDDDVH